MDLLMTEIDTSNDTNVIGLGFLVLNVDGLRNESHVSLPQNPS